MNPSGLAQPSFDIRDPGDQRHGLHRSFREPETQVEVSRPFVQCVNQNGCNADFLGGSRYPQDGVTQ